MPANILYQNLADAGTASASSWVAASPPATMQNPHVHRRWKGRLGDTEWVLIDLGDDLEFDTVVLLGCAYIDANDEEQNLDSVTQTRLRVSLTDPTGAAGEVYDSTLLSGEIDEAYAQLVKLFATPITGRYVRIDLSRASAQAIMAGRFVIGMREQFTYNFSYGWTFGYADLSRRRKSAGGQTFIERDDRYRVLTLTFDVMDQTDRYSFVHDIDRLNGISQDVLFVINPNSATLDRDCIWGLLQDMTPPVGRMPTSVQGIDIFSKSYSIEERR